MRTKRLLSFLLAMLMVIGTIVSTLPAMEVKAAQKFYWPVDTKHKISTGYYGYSGHNGVDIAAPLGTPVYATFAGTAVFYQIYTVINGVQKLTSYGNCVYVTSSDGYFAQYAHLNSFYGYSLQIPSTQTEVKSGSQDKIEIGRRPVNVGDLIGYVGTTGNSTGPHLHYGLKINGNYVNPENYLDRSQCANNGGIPPIGPDPTPPSNPTQNSTIIHIDHPSSGSYPNNCGNIEISGWIATDEANVTSVKMSIGGYGDIVLNGGAITHASDVKKAYPNHKYTVRFRGVIERSRLKDNTKYNYTITSNVSGSYNGQFTIGQHIESHPVQPADHIIHLDSPVGNYVGYNHIELKGWIACNTKPAYIMAEIPGKQYNMEFYDNVPTESYPGYKYFMRFYTVIDINLLSSNQTYPIKIWSSLGGLWTSTFSTGNIAPTKYGVNFNNNGGSGSIQGLTVISGEKATIPSTTPTRNGYTFLGWATSSTATTANYKPGSSFTVKSNVTLYAVWKPNTYTVSYDMNGGTGTIANQTKTHGVNLTLSSIVPKKDGYVFSGWDLDKEAIVSAFKPGDVLAIDDNVVLYAVWEKSYTVSFNANGGDSAPKAQTTTGEITLPDALKRDGYKFAGWRKGDNQISILYPAGSVLTVSSDTTFYAIWECIHQYNSVKTEATCVDAGYTTYTCKTCGKSYVGNEVAPLGHNVVKHSAKAATCTEKGWKAYETCSRCDYTTYEEIKALGHNIVKHNAKAATCTEKGWKAYETCSKCDHTTYEEIKALGHSYDSWKVTTAATCTKGGVERRDCVNCDHYESRGTDALGHNIVKHNAKAATCTEKGWKAYETCSRCDYTTYVEIPAVGHSYKSVVTPPTTTSEGYTTHTCSNCGHSYKDSYVDKLPDENAPVITVSTEKGSIGGTVDVTISIDKNSGITGALLKIDYNPAFVIKNVVKGDAFASLSFSELAVPYLNPLYIAWDGLRDDKTNGTLVTITFEIPEDMEVGEYPIVVTYASGCIYDEMLNDVTVNIINGVIEVTDIMYGDVNNDGTINGKDVTLLRRFLTGGFDMSSFVEQAADVNLDGSVNGKDVTLIRRYLTGGFGVELGK